MIEKLYHIDRSNLLECGTLNNLKKELDLEADSEINNYFNESLRRYYPNGLSYHGYSYFINIINNASSAIDVVYEYERLLNFPNKLSRYESFFAFNKEGLIEFIKTNNLTSYRIFEVESDYCEKYDMNLLRGDRHFCLSAMAKKYWGHEENNMVPPLYEYLLKFPIRILKEITFEEL